MPRLPLSDKELAAFRVRALDAAEELHRKGGIEALSMRNLARALGYSPMTPYRYFDDHEALIAAMRTRAFDRFAADQQRAIGEHEDALTRIAALGRAYINFALADPNSYRLMFDLVPPTRRHPALERASRAAFAALLTAVGEAVADKRLDGPTAVRAHLIWAQVHGVVSLSLADKLKFGVGVEELAELLLGSFEEK